MERVVITGMGFLSPLGNDWPTVREALYENRSAVRHMTDWDETDLNTRVAAPVAPYSLDPELFSRKRTRAMGRVALMAVKASYDALVAAGLLGHLVLTSGDCGVAYGSSAGQPAAVAELANLILTKTCRGITATTYVRMMSHTAAVNIGIYFGLKGRIIPTSSACTSGSQGIGMAYEAIRYGKQKVMIAGGSEELDATDAAIFDTLFATSCRYNDTPEQTPRPFDKDRDGLVVGEGAGTLVLESLSHAKARGARIYAEVLGFGENSDGVHITTPQSEQMGRAMELALEDAGSRNPTPRRGSSATAFPTPPTRGTWGTRSAPAGRSKRSSLCGPWRRALSLPFSISRSPTRPAQICNTCVMPSALWSKMSL